MSIHLRTFAAGCAFTLAVFAATSLGAGTQPKPPTHGISTAVISNFPPASTPSLADKVAALTRRVDRLQNDAAVARQNERAIIAATNDALAASQAAQDASACLEDAYQVAWNDAGQLVSNNDEPSTSNFLIVTLSRDCGS